MKPCHNDVCRWKAGLMARANHTDAMQIISITHVWKMTKMINDNFDTVPLVPNASPTLAIFSINSARAK
eukprot:4992445-Karenia_brevis.AAC.1